MIITNHRKKLINAIVFFARNTRKCGKTKLLKLLYFLDFWHFKQTGRPVTGLEYFAWEMGPVPKELFTELTGNMRPDMNAAIHELDAGSEFQKVRPRAEFDDRYFSGRELRLLKELSFIFHDADAKDMVESTHLLNEPWDKTLRSKGAFSKIDYLLAVDGADESLPYEEARERMEEREQMYEVFGVE